MRNWVWIMAMALGLVACDKPKDQLPLNWKPENVSLQCPSGECPSGTGLLLFVRREKRALKVLHCSGTLISESAILTNEHCDLTRQPRTKGYFFAQDGGTTVFSQISGEQFKVKGKASGLDRDLAILKLSEPLKMPPRKIARKIPPSMDSLVSFVANRQRVGRYSLDKITCRTKDKMALYGGGVAQNHTGLALFDCPVIPGNSGAALFTPENLNEIQVVMNTVWKFGSKADEATQVSSLFLDEPEYFRTGYAMGERVHCQDIKGQDEPEVKCLSVNFERTMGDPFRAVVAKEVQRRIAQNQSHSDIVWITEVFNVQTRIDNTQRSMPAVILAPRPYCLRSRNGKMQELKFTYLKLGLLKDGTAGTQQIAEDRMQVAVTGIKHGNVELMFNVIPEAKGSNFAFKPLDRAKFTALADPSSVSRLPACDAQSIEEAAEMSLHNIRAITVNDPARL